jgi:hypothetical protein
MSKLRPRFDQKLVQLTLPLSELPSQKLRNGALRVTGAVKEALGLALKACGLNREIVADELTRLTGQNVSIHTLDNWASPAKADRCLPLEMAGALAVITGDIRIIQAAVEAAGYLVLDQEGAAIYEYGKMCAEDEERAKLKRALKERIRK